eukprot:4525356-Prymnesium_polylepis.2
MVSYLLSKHIRSGGDDTRCACPICCVDLTLREESFAEWMQCPSCNTVGHSSCIRRCVLLVDTFLCPVCRTSYDTEYMVSDPSAWSAVDLQQRLKSDRDDQEYEIVIEVQRASARIAQVALAVCCHLVAIEASIRASSWSTIRSMTWAGVLART